MEEKITIKTCNNKGKSIQNEVSDLIKTCNKKIFEGMMIPAEYLKEISGYSIAPCRTVMFTGGDGSSLVDIAKFDEKKDIDI